MTLPADVYGNLSSCREVTMSTLYIKTMYREKVKSHMLHSGTTTIRTSNKISHEKVPKSTILVIDNDSN